jgi:tetratricopeptide (TPR) repeat protein
MELTALDSSVATIIVSALETRWPFTARATSADFLSHYTPSRLTDSLAVEVATGRRHWTDAKLAAAARFEQRSEFDAALGEYRGLMRDQPWNESPFRFGARAALAGKRVADARAFLERAYVLQPTPYTCLTLGRLVAGDSTQLTRAALLVRQSMELGGFNPDAAYQLSLIFARQGNVAAARSTAAALYRLAPNYPGLAAWIRLLGVR